MLVDLNRGRLLITGGAGFMGSAFIRMILENKGFEGHLFNLDALTYCGNLDNLQLIQEDKRYTFVEGNITNKSLLKTLVAKEKIEAIVHFAAETHVDRSIEDGAAFVKTNVLGTYFLLEIVREFPHIHFHHLQLVLRRRKHVLLVSRLVFVVLAACTHGATQRPVNHVRV